MNKTAEQILAVLFMTPFDSSTENDPPELPPTEISTHCTFKTKFIVHG